LKIIDPLQLKSALSSMEQWGHRLPQALLHLRMVRESALVDAMATATKSEKMDLADRLPEQRTLGLLDASFCQDHGVLPLEVMQNIRTLKVAMADPSDLGLLDEISSRAQLRVKAYVAGETAIQKAIQRSYFGLQVTFEEGALEKPISELDELKLVNASGKTMALTGAVVSMKKALQEKAAAAARALETTSSPTPAAVDEMPEAVSFEPLHLEDSQAQIARLEEEVNEVKKQVTQLRKNQMTAQLTLKALVELLIEKKQLSGSELRARMAKAPRGKS
jgi:hypothetical protein